MKLNKTESKILSRIQDGRIVVEWCGSSPRGGGKFRGEGRREFRAAEKLVERGVLVEIKREHSSWVAANGSQCRSTILICALSK